MRDAGHLAICKPGIPRAPRESPARDVLLDRGVLDGVHRRELALTAAERLLGAQTRSEARRMARLELWAVSGCVTCRWFVLQLPPVTSTTQPRDLVDAVDPWEKDEHALRVAAAWIVLRGR